MANSTLDEPCAANVGLATPEVAESGITSRDGGECGVLRPGFGCIGFVARGKLPARMVAAWIRLRQSGNFSLASPPAASVQLSVL